MNVYQTTVSDFRTGQGTANATPQRIVEPGIIPKAYKGLQIRCLTGTLFVTRNAVSVGYELPTGKTTFLFVENPATVYVVSPGGATYAWLCC